ncbi:MAG: glycoside hydrolase family 3 C-terminal domain-containing protein [Limisphaerales bacterium]
MLRTTIRWILATSIHHRPLIIVSLLVSISLRGADVPLYQNTTAPLEQRVDDLFGRLTQDEKLSLLGGTGFTTRPIPRLGVPPMAMADAGQGVRGGPGSTLGPATAFPAGVCMAATWDTNLIWQVGQAIGDEARNKGAGIQIELGPAINIHRSPLGGRNGEFFTEDPFLNARLAVAFIPGLQSTGVGACVKHYVCNNQETDRNAINETVSERALREIYLPGFEAAVKEAKVWSVMDAYNQVNGLHCSANPYLLEDILKKEWGFDGLVMSDWGAVHATDAVQAGNDLEMPNGRYMSVSRLQAALADGGITQAAVDDSVHRILRTIVRTGLLDGPIRQDPSQVNSPAHAALALKVAEEGIVLLKNQKNLLPLNSQEVHSITLIGKAGNDFQVDALGSPAVPPLRTVQILEGLKARAGNATMDYVPADGSGELIPVSAVTTPDGSAHGFKAEYYENRRLEESPAFVRVDETIDLQPPPSPAPDFPTTNFSVRWTGKLIAPATGRYVFTFTSGGGCRVFLDDRPIIDHWRTGSRSFRAEEDLVAGQTYDLRIEYFQVGGDYVARLAWLPPGESPYADAVAAAKKADVAIVCVDTRRTEGEGADRPSMDLPAHQDELIQAVAAANHNTIVLLNTGTPVTMTNWLRQTPAVIEAWFPGQEGGTALAAILFGDVNPSGKLPDTFAASRDDYPDAGNFPGKNGQVNYAEGIYVGYRHFDKNRIEPVFPFGYGLSYTKFHYKNLRLSSPRFGPDGSLVASVDITNTGKRAGDEVAELYLHDPHPKIDKPVRELKGFAKVALKPGETRTVQFNVQPRDLAYFDTAGHQWKADAGDYEIEIGASSRDIQRTATLQLTGEFTEKVLAN